MRAVSTKPRLPLRVKLLWAMGSLGDNYAGNAINQLKDAVYTVALGIPPELIGLVLSLPRLVDALVDPVVGIWSDKHRGRYGRRAPFIVFGAIALGFSMASIWLPPTGAGWGKAAQAGYFLGATVFFYAAYSVFVVPYRALGFELTSDYDDRTRLQAWGMVIGLVGGLGLPWLYKLSLLCGGAPAHGVTSQVILRGAHWVGAGVGLLILVTCVVPAFAAREAAGGADLPAGAPLSLRATILTTCRNRSFLQVLGMNSCAIVGMYSPVTISLLISIYFLFAGDQQAAANLLGFVGMSQMLGSLAGVPVNTALSVRWGKRPVALISIALAAVGFGSQWWTLLPLHPYWAVTSNFLIGWGMQGIWLMAATMIADVCDDDELRTGRRRQGLYGAVFALSQKIAFAVAAILGGFLVRLCGYTTGVAPTTATLAHLRATLILTPAVSMVLAAGCIALYSLSHHRVREIQVRIAARLPLGATAGNPSSIVANQNPSSRSYF